jgi:hypothetical protein
MSHPKTVIRYGYGAFLIGTILLALGAVAQTPSGLGLNTNQPSELIVKLYPGELVGHEQVIRQLIKCGTNEFIFVVPEGLRAETLPKGVIMLYGREMNYYASIRIVPPPPAPAGLKASLLEQIASEYSQASGVEEFATTVADREGTGFQLRQDLPKTGDRLVRILWVPFKAGVVEFVVNADHHSAAIGREALDMILLTFRANERGSLEIIERSDKS